MHYQESEQKIYFTKDYGLFRTIQGNRELDEKRIETIMQDIKSGIDVLKFYPIQVSESSDGRLDIIDGQHRRFIAQKLKVPVHFIILPKKLDLVEIAKINSNVGKWKTKDYINTYTQLNNHNYKNLGSFIEKYKISPSLAIRLLSSPDPLLMPECSKEQFERGYFVATYYTQACELADLCYMFNDFQNWRSRAFFIAIHKINAQKKVDILALAEKVRRNIDDLAPSTHSYRDYIFNLENIWNKGGRNRHIIWESEEQSSKPKTETKNREEEPVNT